ncbi:diaminopimelate decarboxylase [Rhodococcus opacus]|nr:diaminopimelate decarboxylase [Rhodococcus opacus]
MMDSGRSGRSILSSVLTHTDHLTVDDDGQLRIEGCAAKQLLEEHGSPLSVVSESTLRANANRVRLAFEDRWPAAVNVMFAIKANNNIAVRRVLSSLGLGGDCFSSGEIYATLAGGTDPSRVALNGSNKSTEAIAEAIERGIVINLDSMDELRLVEEIALTAGQRARVAVRLRLDGSKYDAARDRDSSLPDLRHFIDTEQVGSSRNAARDLLHAAMASERMLAVGYHFHLGRLSRLPAYYRWWSAGVAELVEELWRDTAFVPEILNIGGGYAREREPERGDETVMNPYTIEDYAETVTAQLRIVFERNDISAPELWLEPGRYLAGNAGLLLCRVGAVKSDVGMTWVNVDVSINNLPRVENAGWDYVALPASNMDAPAGSRSDVVGSLCVGKHLKIDIALPRLGRDDVLAFLDTGAYAETASTQYNAVPRPATVLVHENRSWVIKRRETIEDLFALQVVPAHLEDAGMNPRSHQLHTARPGGRS